MTEPIITPIKIIKFDSREEWLDARVGKITGTRLKDLISLRGAGKKKGFYELIAERVAVPADGENTMERGIRLESEAVERFEKETGKKVNSDLVLWVSDLDENIAISPDGYINQTEAIEIKCINSASHIEALLTQEIPAEYKFQVLQYFIVNPKLKKLFFIFYDPRIPAKDYFVITVERKDVEDDVKKYLEEELAIIKEVEAITLNLTF